MFIGRHRHNVSECIPALSHEYGWLADAFMAWLLGFDNIDNVVLWFIGAYLGDLATTHCLGHTAGDFVRMFDW